MAWKDLSFVEKITRFTAAVGNNIELGIEEAKAAAQSALERAEALPTDTALGSLGAGTTNVNCSQNGLVACALTANRTFHLENEPASGYAEVAIEWEVSTEGSVPTFTAAASTIYWPNGEPAWNTTAGARNVAFFVVRKAASKIILGEA